MMNVKENLVSMVESVLICSRVFTATVLGLDTLEATVKSEVRKPMMNLLPRWFPLRLFKQHNHSSWILIHALHEISMYS